LSRLKIYGRKRDTGAHPDELKEIIVDSRKKFVQLLTQKQIESPYGTVDKDGNIGKIDNPLFNRKISASDAKKLAGKHIKATFDVGHANTWRKHFQGDDKDFKKWLMTKVKDMQTSGIMGHVHMSDNFGYEDEHATLGEGTVPIKEFVETVRKAGYKGQMVAEPAHNDYKALLGAWRSLNSPVYRIDHTSRSWTDVEHGYFGRTFSPNYTFQSYLPIGDGKTPMTWGEVPIE